MNPIRSHWISQGLSPKTPWIPSDPIGFHKIWYLKSHEYHQNPLDFIRLALITCSYFGSFFSFRRKDLLAKISHFSMGWQWWHYLQLFWLVFSLRKGDLLAKISLCSTAGWLIRSRLVQIPMREEWGNHHAENLSRVMIFIKNFGFLKKKGFQHWWLINRG